MHLRIPVNGITTELVLEDDPTRTEPEPFNDNNRRKLNLEHLPPLILSLIVNSKYPEDEPPQIHSITSAHSWLSPHLTNVTGKCLLRLWRPGEYILCSWVDYILSGDFLRGLGPVQVTSSLAHILILYNANTTDSKFLEQAFTCPVCQSSVKGNKTLQLSCGHVICRNCLLDYWSFSIREGDLDHVCCPDLDCIKQGIVVSHRELEQVLSPEMVNRWRWLSEKRRHERDPTVCICPIPTCQMIVPFPTRLEEEGTGWSRLRTCTSCDFCFCFICRRTWHGPHTPCVASTTAEYILEYISLEPESPGRLALERRFGRTLLRKVVAQYEEDRLNEALFNDLTTPCPGCNIKIEKAMGCNHMTCMKCKQHFCYLCGDKLKASNPYRHFSNEQSPCYNRLFDLNAADPDDLQWIHAEVPDI